MFFVIKVYSCYFWNRNSCFILYVVLSYWYNKGIGVFKYVFLMRYNIYKYSVENFEIFLLYIFEG